MTYLWLTLFLVMTLRVGLGAIQVKAYQRAVSALRGTGTVGVGHTKAGWTHTGQIVVLSYKQSENRVVGCKVMTGITLFARFKDDADVVGMTLEDIRARGIAEDAKAFRATRKRHPYDPEEVSIKKGALIQAVEAIERRLKEDARRESTQEQIAARRAQLSAKAN